MWLTRGGSEIMQRIAVPMIGHTVSSTVLTLIVIPAIYSLVKAKAPRVRALAAPSPAQHRSPYVACVARPTQP